LTTVHAPRIFLDFLNVGTTPTGQKLRELFAGYLPLLDSVNNDAPSIVIMVITDGVPSDDFSNSCLVVS